jgi:hypothetical protein
MQHIYQASDLAAKRRELLDAARTGYAQIRDTDGTGLVLLLGHRFQLLCALREQLSRFLTLEAALEKPANERRLTDFGEFAWLAAFEEDDQRTFRHELMEALLQSLATDSMEPAESCLQDWRTTARALSSEKSHRILTAPGEDLASYDEAKRPE